MCRVRYHGAEVLRRLCGKDREMQGTLRILPAESPPTPPPPYLKFSLRTRLVKSKWERHMSISVDCWHRHQHSFPAVGRSDTRVSAASCVCRPKGQKEAHWLAMPQPLHADNLPTLKQGLHKGQLSIPAHLIHPTWRLAVLWSSRCLALRTTDTGPA